jgi:hypothetical protein
MRLYNSHVIAAKDEAMTNINFSGHKQILVSSVSTAEGNSCIRMPYIML